MNELIEYNNIVENTDTLLSVIVYDKKVCDIIKFFEDQLERAKKISNPIKKQKINNRLFIFIKYLNDIYQDQDIIINYIFLIHEKIISYHLSKFEIDTAREYNFFNIYFKYDSKFHIDHFIDLFYNFNFIYTIKINKYDIHIIKLNKNKDKEIDIGKLTNELKIFDFVEKIRSNYGYKDLIILHGNSQLINKYEANNKHKDNMPIIICKDFLSKEDCFNLYSDECMKKNLLLLENKLLELNNGKSNIDIFIFGKLKFEFKDAIESYLLKELFIEENKLEKLKTIIDNSFLNFKIIPIKSLTTGDIGDQFIKNYNGLMGIKYY